MAVQSFPCSELYYFEMKCFEYFWFDKSNRMLREPATDRDKFTTWARLANKIYHAAFLGHIRHDVIQMFLQMRLLLLYGI